MTEIRLTLSNDEWELVVRLLEQELSETRTEFRHTDSSPDYREQVRAEEHLLRELLDKMRHSAGPPWPTVATTH